MLQDVVKAFQADLEFADYDTRLASASSIYCPSSTALALLKDPSESVRSELASNPACPPDLLEKLALDTQKTVFYAVAQNPNTPASVLDGFMSNRSLHQVLASNRSTSPATLSRILSLSTERYVRLTVAGNSSCFPETLETIFRHPQLQQKVSHFPKALASNPSTPLNVLESIMATGDVFLQAVVAANPKYPVNELKLLATHAPQPVLVALASNRACTPEILTLLASYDALEINFSLASNPSTPAEVLESFTENIFLQTSVAVFLAQNPSCTPAMLEQIYVSSPPGTVMPELVIANPSCPPHLVLEETFKDLSPLRKFNALDKYLSLVSSNTIKPEVNVLKNVVKNICEATEPSLVFDLGFNLLNILNKPHGLTSQDLQELVMFTQNVSDVTLPVFKPKPVLKNRSRGINPLGF